MHRQQNLSIQMEFIVCLDIQIFQNSEKVSMEKIFWINDDTSTSQVKLLAACSMVAAANQPELIILLI